VPPNNFGLFDLYAFLRSRLAKSHIAILVYHRVCPRTDEWSQESYLHVVDPRSFEEQMRYIAREFRVLSLQEVAENVQSGKDFREKAAAVTFDDGYKDNYAYAYPILKKYGISATFFLATGYITDCRLFWWDRIAYILRHTSIKELRFESNRYSLLSDRDKSSATSLIIKGLKKLSWNKMDIWIQKLVTVCKVNIPADLASRLILSWKDIRKMESRDISFGAHSVNHPILTSMSLEQARLEIIQSKKDIENKLGKAVTAFSYPNGNFSPEIVETVRQSGFECAVSILNEKLICCKDNVYELNRIVASQDFTKFKAKICGLWGDLPKLAHNALEKFDAIS
jgi:peptidoglycan/xylan/chitin deacetylase (PgdA/CDA1 family)